MFSFVFLIGAFGAPFPLELKNLKTYKKMKNTINSLAALALACGTLLSSCMTAGNTTQGTTGATTSSQSTNTALQTGAAVASALLSQQAQTNSTAAAANSVLSAVNNGSLISGIVGLLTGGATSANSIVGTWNYSEPTVQFQSENLLAQAGGVYIAQSMVSKLAPYYEKFGFKKGVFRATFNSDNTCSIVFGQRTIPGTYTFNPSTNTLNIKGQFGLVNLTAYVTVTANQMALTFDSSKFLSLATVLSGGANAGNAQASAISQLANSYTGMKTGFLLTK